MSDWPELANRLLFHHEVVGAAEATIDTLANGIDPNYKMIDIFAYLRTDETVATSALNINVNGDTSAIYDRIFGGTSNASFSGGNSLAQTKWAFNVAGDSEALAGVFSFFNIRIYNYAGGVGNKNGTVVTGITDSTAANDSVLTYVLGYRSTSAINQIALSIATAAKKFKIGSMMSIWGYR